jgi:hypoxanthine phosphoribosyltransferase
MTRTVQKYDWTYFGILVDVLVEEVLVKHRESAFTDIIGVAKGGLVPMAAICNAPELSGVRMHVFTVSHYSGRERKSQATLQQSTNIFKRWMQDGGDVAMRVLVVEDVIDTGSTINKVRDVVMLYRAALRAPPEVQFTYATVIASHRHSARSDIITATFKKDDDWIVLPYEESDG